MQCVSRLLPVRCACAAHRSRSVRRDGGTGALARDAPSLLAFNSAARASCASRFALRALSDLCVLTVFDDD